MPNLTVQDIIVVPTYMEGKNIGEAPHRGEKHPIMTPDERIHMVDQLFAAVSALMEEARATHSVNNKMPGVDAINYDYITKLSTPEFYFYTKEPLTLEEFELLQNRIIHFAKEFPSGIHLLLGSFAVKTPDPDNRVMNVVPHIACGDPPSINLIVKNQTSPIDVRYKAADGGSLKMLDNTADDPEIHFNINIGGIQQPFSFNNVIHYTMPNKTDVLIIPEICLDHSYQCAQLNLDKFLQKHPDANKFFVIHEVLSNTIQLDPLNCIGHVTHVDPRYTSLRYKKAVQQEEKIPEDLCFFGKNTVKIYKLAQRSCQTQEHIDREKQDVMNRYQRVQDDYEQCQDLIWLTNGQDVIPLSEINESRRMRSVGAVVEEIETIHHEFQQEVRQFIENILIQLNYNPDEIQKARQKLEQADNAPEMLSILIDVSNDLNKLFHNEINELNALGFGPQDKQLQQFITEKKADFLHANMPRQNEIIHELRTTLENLKSCEATADIHKIITKLNKSTFSFFSRNNKKAESISALMGTIPIEARGDLINSPEYPKVLKAIAVGTASRFSRNILLPTGEIDESSASNTFRIFKAKYKEPSKENRAELKEENHPDVKL